MARVTALYGEDHDLDHREAPPSVRLMIATLPRSGSTAFGLSLWSTGVLGAPLEYAHATYAGGIRERLGTGRSFAGFWREVQRRRTSANGVFSYKMFQSDLMALARRDFAAYPCVLPSHAVLFRRRDRAAHAISMSKAIQTHQWFSDDAPKRVPTFNLAHLLWCEGRIADQERFWLEFLQKSELPFVEVFYEDFHANGTDELRKIARFIGLADCPEPSDVERNVTAVQRDGHSQAWKQRLLDAKRLLNQGFSAFPAFHASSHAG